MSKNEVNISSQIVLMFIPIIDIWAFYRIKKLRKFTLFAVIPVILVVFVGSELIELENIELNIIKENPKNITEYQKHFEMQRDKIITSQHMPIIVGLEIGLIVLRLYLVIRWSNKWNKELKK